MTGIYQIKNICNGKVYVGSAIDIDKRWGTHIRALKRGDHRNIHLQRSWNKYGQASFEFSVLEETTESTLIEREQFYLDKLYSADHSKGFNIAPTAGNSLGIKRRPETIEKVRAARKGSTLTEEHKANIGEAIRNSEAHKIAHNNPEYKERQRQANLGEKNHMFGKCGKEHARSRPVTQHDKDTGALIKEWGSANMAATELGFGQGNITSCCKGKLKQAYGFVWRYADETKNN